jgi:hypothetical protein
MKSGLLIVMAAMAMGGCATRFVQDVTVENGVLLVKECTLINHEVWTQDCIDRKYPLK